MAQDPVDQEYILGRNFHNPSQLSLSLYSSPLFRVEARGILISFNDKVLLVQRSWNDSFMPYAWEFPRGKVESNETLDECLTREIYEETSIHVISPLIIDSSISSKINAENKPALISIHFLADEFYGDVILSKEHQASMWLNIYDVFQMNLRSPCKHALEKVMQLRERFY